MGSTAPSAEHVPDWPAYYDASKGKPPRDTLLEAIDRFDQEQLPDARRVAVDIGCGEGRDTRALASAGYRVLAIDPEPEAIRRTIASLDPAIASRIEVRQSGVGDFELDQGRFAIINASFVLPFVAPDRFQQVWAGIMRSLCAGGRFCGQFFGIHDTWKNTPGRSHFSRQQIITMLAPLCIERLDEHEKDGKDMTGNPKHFHVFHVVARRRTGESQ